MGAHNAVVGADQGLRAPSWDQESVRDSVHEDSASARIATGQRPRPSFRHPQATPGTGMRRDPRPPRSDPRCSPSGPSRSPATDQVSSSSSSSATPSPPSGMGRSIPQNPLKFQGSFEPTLGIPRSRGHDSPFRWGWGTAPGEDRGTVQAFRLVGDQAHRRRWVGSSTLTFGQVSGGAQASDSGHSPIRARLPQ